MSGLRLRQVHAPGGELIGHHATSWTGDIIRRLLQLPDQVRKQRRTLSDDLLKIARHLSGQSITSGSPPGSILVKQAGSIAACRAA